MQKTLILILLIVSANFISPAQDVGFSQFYANMLYLNPALAGTTKCPKFALSYRNHYPTLPNVYTTYSASYDQYFKPLHGGVGILIMRDDQGKGTINSTGIAAMYAFTFKVTRKMYLKAGFQGGFVSRSVNSGSVIFPDMINEATGELQAGGEGFTDKTANNIDFAAGLAGYAENFYFGAAVHHLTEWKSSASGSDYFISAQKYTVHAGVEIPLGGGKESNLSISPNIVAQMQDQYQQINYGFYTKMRSFVTGLWVKQNFGIEINTASILLGFYRGGVKFGYSFDFPLSALRNDFFVAHEVSLGIVLPCGTKNKVWEAISCPKF